MVTSSEPLVALVPVQVPVAVHEVALVEDQVRVITVSINTDEDDEERDEVGLDSGAGAPPRSTSYERMYPSAGGSRAAREAWCGAAM